jgi:hypothetical protein
MGQMIGRMNKMTDRLEALENQSIVAPITAVSTVPAFVNPEPVSSVTSAMAPTPGPTVDQMPASTVAPAPVSIVATVAPTPVSAVVPAFDIQRREEPKEIWDINLLQGQLSGVKDPVTLLALQAKTRHFCKLDGSSKLTIQGGHIEKGQNTRLRPAINRV